MALLLAFAPIPLFMPVLFVAAVGVFEVLSTAVPLALPLVSVKAAAGPAGGKVAVAVGWAGAAVELAV